MVWSEAHRTDPFAEQRAAARDYDREHPCQHRDAGGAWLFRPHAFFGRRQVEYRCTYCGLVRSAPRGTY